MADITGNEILGRALKNEGTRDLFFIMGGPMQHAETACAKEGIRMIDVRHEQAAALSAQAYARLKQQPAVCMAAAVPAMERALASLKAACDKKDGIGCGTLGDLKRIGRRADRNLVDARAHYQVACDAGVVDSCVELGVLIATGRGGARDLAAASALLDKACGSRSTRGCVQSARVKFVTRTTKDAAPFLTQFDEACKNGDLGGCDYAADLLMRGEGVARDEKRGVTFLTTACDKGYADSCNNLGEAYVRGAGVSKDRPKAATLFEKACLSANPHGCWNLGKLVLKGDDGIPKDGNKALELFKGSCADDDSSGCVSLAEMYDRGDQVAKDRDEAGKWFDRACTLGWDDRRCRDKK